MEARLHSVRAKTAYEARSADYFLRRKEGSPPHVSSSVNSSVRGASFGVSAFCSRVSLIGAAEASIIFFASERSARTGGTSTGSLRGAVEMRWAVGEGVRVDISGKPVAMTVTRTAPFLSVGSVTG